MEGAVYQRYLGGPVAKSIWLALGVNILSTLIVGIGLPFAVAFISGIGIFIGGEIGGIFAALGSWVFKDSPYRDFAIAITIPWMIISFWLTLKFELWYLTQRLQIDAGGQTNIKAMCFYANVVGYGGLLIIALVVAVLYNL